MKFDLVVLCTKFWIDLLGVVNMSSVTVIFALIYSTNIYGIFNVYMLEILYETSILRDFVKIDSVKKKMHALLIGMTEILSAFSTHFIIQCNIDLKNNIVGV